MARRAKAWKGATLDLGSAERPGAPSGSETGATRNSIARALGLLLVLGCGMGPMGVMSVEIGLRPMAVASWPTDVDPALYVTLPQSSGYVYVDGATDTGKVLVGPLPFPPAGYFYFASLEIAEEPRAGLPGGEPAELTRVPIGPLAPGMAEGFWIASFGADELGGLSPTGLRTAAIVLAGVGGERTLLGGSVQQQFNEQPASTSAGGGRHVH